jgi:hypothetical protein
VLGFLGALVYFAFLYLYQQFYNPLELAPEDVGLDRAAILVRAAGALVLLVPIVLFVFFYMMFVVFVSLVATGFLRLFDWLLSRITRTSIEHSSMLAKFDKWRVKNLEWWWWSLVIFPVSDKASRSILRKVIAPSTLFRLAAQSLFIGIVLSFIFLVPRVNDQAEKAAKGEAVQPIRFAGLTVLDIKSLPATVEWVGTRPAPTSLPTQMNFLGRSASVVYFRSSENTIGAPINAVNVTLK